MDQEAGACMLDWQQCEAAKGAACVSEWLHHASPGRHAVLAAVKAVQGTACLYLACCITPSSSNEGIAHQGVHNIKEALLLMRKSRDGRQPHKYRAQGHSQPVVEAVSCMVETGLQSVWPSILLAELLTASCNLQRGPGNEQSVR